MAEKRMFSKIIIDNDVFMDMPLSTQALYFHLCLSADGEGFIGNPRRILKTIGASEDDFKILILKRYILVFDSGVIVIKHWRIHNNLEKNYTPTSYVEEKSQLMLDAKGSYVEKNKDSSLKQNNILFLKDNILEEKDNNIIEENIIDKERKYISKERNSDADYTSDLDILGYIPTLQDVKDYIALKSYNIDPEYFYDYYTARGWKINGQKIENWQYLVNTWGKRNAISNGYKKIAQNNLDKSVKFQQRDYSDNAMGKFGTIEINDEDI